MLNHQYTEKEIIEGCLRNDRLFQELLYKRYAPPLLRLCLRKLKDRDTAMIVVNNGFLKVYKNLKSYSFTGSLEGWMHRIVYRSIADYYRSESTQIRSNTVFLEFERMADEHLLEELYLEDLLGLAKQLPPATYKVFLLYLVEGFKHKEIAEKLNISINTSKWHLAEAKKIMQTIIKSNSSDYAKG